VLHGVCLNSLSVDDPKEQWGIKCTYFVEIFDSSEHSLPVHTAQMSVEYAVFFVLLAKELGQVYITTFQQYQQPITFIFAKISNQSGGQREMTA